MILWLEQIPTFLSLSSSFMHLFLLSKSIFVFNAINYLIKLHLHVIISIKQVSPLTLIHKIIIAFCCWQLAHHSCNQGSSPYSSVWHELNEWRMKINDHKYWYVVYIDAYQKILIDNISNLSSSGIANHVFGQ